jgi:SNF2 family DNA or RNA helicase
VHFTLLAELGLTKQDQEKVHGDLPQAILDAVRELELNTDHLKVSLRGYQSFAARFALVQKRVLIGDEMGLGKTVEALAVLAHLRSRGKSHFLVVCPASVVTNWVREVSSKTELPAHRLHGYDREQSARNWRRRGGMAVTTYESLGWYLNQVPSQVIECVILDEAHAIKNPTAQRSLRSSRLLASSPVAVLMTGTPLENRVDEYRQLVGHIRPDLAGNSPELAKQFRRHVAPAYLRRNLEDVLTELPERIEVQEWLPMSGSDLATYRAAVAEGNFMALRQAAMLGGQDSQKVMRLLEIVEEAEDNQRKVSGRMRGHDDFPNCRRVRHCIPRAGARWVSGRSTVVCSGRNLAGLTHHACRSSASLRATDVQLLSRA